MFGLSQIRPEARTSDGSRKRLNWAKRYIKMREAFKRAAGIMHTHREENARRVRQISRGILTQSNGLVSE